MKKNLNRYDFNNVKQLKKEVNPILKDEENLQLNQALEKIAELEQKYAKKLIDFKNQNKELSETQNFCFIYLCSYLYDLHIQYNLKINDIFDVIKSVIICLYNSEKKENLDYELLINYADYSKNVYLISEVLIDAGKSVKISEKESFNISYILLFSLNHQINSIMYYKEEVEEFFQLLEDCNDIVKECIE